MTTQSKEHRIFKLFLRSIASDDLTPDDYRSGLSDLNDPRMVGLLEEVLAALSGDATKTQGRAPESAVPTKSDKVSKKQKSRSSKDADQLFNDIKRRKITRDRLENILHSVDSSFANAAADFDTMRSLLAAYRKYASEREWEILTDIINGNYETDPYFSGAS